MKNPLSTQAYLDFVPFSPDLRQRHAARLCVDQYKDEIGFSISHPESGAIDAVTATVTADNAASFGFGSITYTQADLAGARERTFGYDVREVVPDNAQYSGGGARGSGD